MGGAVALAHNEGKNMVSLLKDNTFSYFGIPHTIISDEGYHFWNKVFRTTLKNYGVNNTIWLPLSSPNELAGGSIQ